MSLILDALRKMEQDRQNRRGAQPEIRREVLRYRALQPRQPRPYLLAALGLVLTTAAIGGAVWFKEREAAPAAQAIEAPAAAPASAPVASPAPGPGPPAPAVSAPSVPKLPRSASKPSGAPVEATRPARLPAAVRPVAQPPQPVAAEQTGAALPDIAISGIAWQDERRLRRAVLNDVLVGEGAEIAGARVVEIREDRVRLSRGGQLFEVLFSSSLSSR